MAEGYRLVFGDIHNHNAHGYGQGSIERSLDIARRHLDFFAFTGHSSWHDLGDYGGRATHFTEGFKRLKETWGRVQRVIADGNDDGRFCAFLGFEWHSNRFGDHCVVFPEDHQPLFYASKVEELRRFCTERSALMIPHHLAYPKGRRGVDWEVYTPECTPVVEVYSWHGSGEEDRGPYPFLSGSPGGRQTYGTARAGLARGFKFGFVASSDNHSGFPGAYGEGLMAAYVRDLTRPAILEAIRARRTYALTGDRIGIDFRAEGQMMGTEFRAGSEVEVDCDVAGCDELDSVDLVLNGEVVARQWPDLRAPKHGPVQVRFEWGWGPWGALNAARITDWAFRLRLTEGRILRVLPCLASGPFDEDRRHSIVQEGEVALSIRSYTSRRDAYAGNANHSVVLQIEAPPSAALVVDRKAPGEQAHTIPLSALAGASEAMHVGPVPAESYMFHRLIPMAASHLRVRRSVKLDDGPNHLYARVTQRNGHMAWASPVFINYPSGS